MQERNLRGESRSVSAHSWMPTDSALEVEWHLQIWLPGTAVMYAAL
jgi:hypothetical protein